MVEIELKSKELTEYIYLTLNKDRSTPLYDDDIDKIKDITLDALDFLDEPTDTTIYDLVFFNNLKTCMIANMNISANEMDVLNKLDSIESIQFTNCVFPKGKKINMHLICDDAGILRGQSLAVVDRFFYSLVGFLRKSGLHHGFIKNIFAEILFYRSHKPFSLNSF